MSVEDHGTPGTEECMACYGDLDKDCYVEYKSVIDGPWLPAKFCEMCVSYLITTQFNKYKDSLANTKCKAEMRRLVEAGPPVNVYDKTALPCEGDGDGDGDGEGEGEGDEKDSTSESESISKGKGTGTGTGTNGEVVALWFMSDGMSHSPKLSGSLMGEEREAYWAEVKAFYSTDEPDEDRADEGKAEAK